MFTRVKTDQEIKYMRESGRMLAAVLELLKKRTEPGMTTKETAGLAAAELKRLGGQPVFLGYGGGGGGKAFPDVLCVSLNDEVVHGIPGEREIQRGDVVSFDFGVDYRGLITDAAFTMIAGTNNSADIKRLLGGTEQALFAAVDVLKDGVRVGDISAAAEAVLKSHRLGIVRDLVGHGVGHQLHEEPNIPNYGTAGTGPVLHSGMTIAIEPMAMLGGESLGVYTDGWTIVTADNSLSAHFEHTILITDSGSEILTRM